MKEDHIFLSGRVHIKEINQWGMVVHIDLAKMLQHGGEHITIQPIWAAAWTISHPFLVLSTQWMSSP